MHNCVQALSLYTTISICSVSNSNWIFSFSTHILSSDLSMPYAKAAAVGSLITRRTFNPAIWPASLVAYEKSNGGFLISRGNHLNPKATEDIRTLADFLPQNCRFFVGVKFVRKSAYHTLADFLSRLTTFSLRAESISAMFEKRLVHVTLMTIPHWLSYRRVPTNCLSPPHTSRQGPTRRFEI